MKTLHALVLSGIITCALSLGMSHPAFASVGQMTPVPEPSTLLLFGAGIVGGLLALKRRKK